MQPDTTISRFLLPVLCLFTFSLYAQVPQGFKYQGVARNETGQPYRSRNINLRISIIDSSSGGVQVYQEVHKTATNEFGLYAITIGRGIQPSGLFDAIPWQTGNKWMRVEIDPNAGSDFTFMGQSELVSVPYALMALTAVNSDDADADPGNELITDVAFNTATGILTIKDNGNIWTADLSSLAHVPLTPGSGISINGNIISNTGDLDATNELNTGFSFNPATKELSLSDAGNTFTVDLSSLGGTSLSAGTGIDISAGIITNTGDLSTANELITDFSFDSSNGMLSITEAGTAHTVNLSALASAPYSAGTGILISGNTIFNTGDLDSLNEMNIAFTFDSSTRLLTLTDGGSSLSVDLSPLAVSTPDNDWIISGNHIYNANSGNVGIGTAAPTAKLHVAGDDGLLATGTLGTGSLPAAGAGVRLMWYPKRAAIRAGRVLSTNWDEPNIGDWSVAMGNNTLASGPCAVAMGEAARAQGAISTAFGENTNAFGPQSTALGSNTNALGTKSTAMGWNTTAAGSQSVAIGNQTIAAGENSFAQGYRTTAAGLNSVTLGNMVSTNNFAGTFMFGDNSRTTLQNASGANQFIVRASGGAYFYSDSGLTTGVFLTPGNSSWSMVSDRNKKENFRQVDHESVLKKLSALEITSWNYKGYSPLTHRHYGPMAQDFYAAFGYDGLGYVGNDTTINTGDMIGISYIALQALEKRTASLQEQILKLMAENAELKNRLSAIEKQLGMEQSSGHKR
ncbi:MAG: hypothetical protein KatS3mg031_0802 [Chitinophagales bacterium]|nr:MAG: hypothetical protein KatS3mg031_0802 [Chitinophagales bacterium]